jgi:hypothetical protein
VEVNPERNDEERRKHTIAAAQAGGYDLDLDLTGLGGPNDALFEAEVFGGVQNSSVLGRE